MEACCPAMDVRWMQQPIDGQIADVQVCVACGTQHLAEPYVLPLRFPYNERCANCGGDLQPDLQDLRCARCGLSEEESRQVHVQLAQIHPIGDPLLAAQALAVSNRNALALKLATAAVRWTPQLAPAMQLRIDLLAAMGYLDQALDEAYEWVERAAGPPLVWSTIAKLEMQQGNPRGAVSALERGIHGHPEIAPLQADYAELQAQLDDRPAALRGATRALRDPGLEQRAVAVIAEVGERYYADGLYAEALGACSLTKDLQETYPTLAWLRARLAASNQDQEYLIRWLERAVALDPSNRDALAMLEPYRKKSGWAFWRS